MIRLSESLAKLHADADIRPEYVKEAVRLLSKSIITIKKDGIEIEEAQIEFDEIAQRRQEEQRRKDADVEMQAQPQTEDKKKVKLSFDEYNKIGNQIVSLFKQKCQLEGQMGIKQQDIVEMYLREEQANILSVQELQDTAKKINSIIQRLIDKENIFIIIEDNPSKQERVLTMNINMEGGFEPK